MKSAIITGAGRGLGAAVAARAAQAGYRVGVLDLDLDAARAASEQLFAAAALQADVADERSFQAALDVFGEVPDLLVNNAGIVRFGALLEQDLSTFREVIEVNLLGTFIPAINVGGRMVERGSGVIVNMTSINALAAGPNSGAYPATKAGVAKLTEQMAIEWGPFGVRVNCVAPGFMDAGMSEPIYADPAVRKRRGDAVPLGRLGLADDVAAAVMFLASDEAAYINGHQLVVDGGVVHSVLAQLRREP